jgi:Fur family transcriptional regulator, stress-responsive regulator
VKTVSELTARLRADGLRVTPQRRCIVGVLEGDTTHPTVEAVHERARMLVPAISLKTVYQTVHDLEALGEVRLLDVGTGAVRVDPNVEHDHHHLVCTVCGRVDDVEVDASGVRPTARARRDFEISAVEIVFRGRCAACRRDG